MSTDTISPAQARRIAVAAQGLDRARPARVTTAHLQRLIDRIGLLQIDSVNVLARAHLLPVLARLGPYDVALLERATQPRPRRRLVEAWAHEASFVPPGVHQELGWWRQEQRENRWVLDFTREHPETLERVRRVLADAGPLTGRQVEAELATASSGGGWWNRSDAKHALEVLFRVGELASAGRTTAFERRYDLAERVVGDQPVLTREDSIRSLVRRSAGSLGIGTVRCLGDYYRLPTADTARAVAELVEEGTLLPVTVPGWKPAYLHAQARLPRSVAARALLAPFDPLVFERSRLLALWGMHYRIGIYTPEPQRTHGYYVLPFLLGDQLVARVDLKADRAAGRLVVKQAHLEPEHRDAGARRRVAWPEPDVVATELVAELGEVRRWLGLGEIVLDGEARGDLVPHLAPALAR